MKIGIRIGKTIVDDIGEQNIVMKEKKNKNNTVSIYSVQLQLKIQFFLYKMYLSIYRKVFINKIL